MRSCQSVFNMMSLEKDIKVVFSEYFDIVKINGNEMNSGTSSRIVHWECAIMVQLKCDQRKKVLRQWH